MAAAVLLAACGDDDDSTAVTTSTSTTTTTTTAPVAEPALVLASPEGVTVDGTVVTTDPAVAAYAIGDVVVFQRQDDTIAVSTGVELAPDPAATAVTLLDAAAVDGRPVALVAERIGEATPETTFEALALLDLTDGSRTELARRPAWEYGHGRGRLLPDGDVIGLAFSEALVLLDRTGEVSWSVEVAFDATVSLAVGDEVAVIRSGAGTLDVTFHDPATGATTGERQLPDTAGARCDDWLNDTELLCHRQGASPVVVSIDDGAVRELDGPADAVATLVR